MDEERHQKHTEKSQSVECENEIENEISIVPSFVGQ